jgi:hypothetical protein
MRYIPGFRSGRSSRPTHENLVFAGAGQRIYLSATLGPGGELEGTFGRAPTVRVPLPTESKPRSGRRLFVFPDLAATDHDAGSYTQQSGDVQWAAHADLEVEFMPRLWIGVDRIEARLRRHMIDRTRNGVVGSRQRVDGL